jgi:hypothetical protein
MWGISTDVYFMVESYIRSAKEKEKYKNGRKLRECDGPSICGKIRSLERGIHILKRMLIAVC